MNTELAQLHLDPARRLIEGYFNDMSDSSKFDLHQAMRLIDCAERLLDSDPEYQQDRCDPVFCSYPNMFGSSQ